MTYDYAITFTLTDTRHFDGIRELFASHLRKSRLRYRSELYWPGGWSGWHTTLSDLSEDPEVTFYIEYSAKQPAAYTALMRQAIAFARSQKGAFEGVEDVSIEKTLHRGYLLHTPHTDAQLVSVEPELEP